MHCVQALRIDLVLQVPNDYASQMGPNTISSLGPHDMLVSQQLENDGFLYEPRQPQQQLQYQDASDSEFYPESWTLSGIDYQMYEKELEQKELV